jgi:hypothetical protein
VNGFKSILTKAKIEAFVKAWQQNFYNWYKCLIEKLVLKIKINVQWYRHYEQLA